MWSRVVSPRIGLDRDEWFRSMVNIAHDNATTSRPTREKTYGGSPQPLSMYDSELFKTVWTKIGQMCSYVTCANSYLSGQFEKRAVPVSRPRIGLDRRSLLPIVANCYPELQSQPLSQSQWQSPSPSQSVVAPRVDEPTTVVVTRIDKNGTRDTVHFFPSFRLGILIRRPTVTRALTFPKLRTSKF